MRVNTGTSNRLGVAPTTTRVISVLSSPSHTESVGVSQSQSSFSQMELKKDGLISLIITSPSLHSYIEWNPELTLKRKVVLKS